MGNIFVVAAWIVGKGSKVASFVGKIFVVRPPKITRYTVVDSFFFHGDIFFIFITNKVTHVVLI